MKKEFGLYCQTLSKMFIMDNYSYFGQKIFSSSETVYLYNNVHAYQHDVYDLYCLCYFIG